MSEGKQEVTAQTEQKTGSGTIRLCTAQGIVYKAYKRPYGNSSAQVLNLFASCFYYDAPWELFFTAVEGEPNKYRLMERVPQIVYFLQTYYAVSYCSGAGLVNLGNKVTLVDAAGEHEVVVESI